MKYLKQFGIIIGISLAGEALHNWLPLPVPASIYGLILMFAALVSGRLKYDTVKETGHFLLEIMAVMFIPAGTGLMTSFDRMRPLLIPYLVITVFSGFAVMLVSGRVTQSLMHREPAESAATGDRSPALRELTDGEPTDRKRKENA